MAVAQRLHRRLDDEVRRAEVGLADAEIDDVAALRRKLHGARQHGKGILLADTIEGGNGFQHGVPRRTEHDPEKWIPVFRKDHAPLRSSAAVQPNRASNANLE